MPILVQLQKIDEGDKETPAMTDVEIVESDHDPEGYMPGSFGCHEALHMASHLCDSVGEALCEHNAVKQNPEWLALAEKAHQALFDLYQAIGAKHL